MTSTQPNQDDAWSDDLMEKTLLQIQSSLDGVTQGDLHLKKNGKCFGVLPAQDLVSGSLIVRREGAEMDEEYSQVEDLMIAGWVID